MGASPADPDLGGAHGWTPARRGQERSQLRDRASQALASPQVWVAVSRGGFLSRTLEKQLWDGQVGLACQSRLRVQS